MKGLQLKNTSMKIPNIGLIVCNSAASNSGMMAGLVAIEAVRRFKDEVSVLSLPTLVNNVLRQSSALKRVKHIIIIDGCHQECARKIAEKLGIKYDAYVKLEYNLGIMKLGPFTTLRYTEENLGRRFS